MKNDCPRVPAPEIRLEEILQRLIEAEPYPGAAHGSRSALHSLTDSLYRERRLREIHFNPVLFGEPAWDILLALRLEAGRDHVPSLSSLPIPSSTSTAHRHIIKLEEEGLIESWRETSDLRCRRIRLTQEGAEAMQAYLAELALNRVLSNRSG
jgi:hypothetical protein